MSISNTRHKGEGKTELKSSAAAIPTVSEISVISKTPIPAATWEEFIRRYFLFEPPSGASSSSKMLRSQISSPKDFLLDKVMLDPRMRRICNKLDKDLFNNLKVAEAKEHKLANNAIDTVTMAFDRLGGWSPVKNIEEYVQRYPSLQKIIGIIVGIKGKFDMHCPEDFEYLKSIMTAYVANAKTSPKTVIAPTLTISQLAEVEQTLQNEKLLAEWVKHTGRQWTPEPWAGKLWIKKLPIFVSFVVPPDWNGSTYHAISLDVGSPVWQAQCWTLSTLKSIDAAIRPLWYYYVTAITPFNSFPASSLSAKSPGVSALTVTDATRIFPATLSAPQSSIKMKRFLSVGERV